jgi:reductive dehalogenase
MDRTTDATRTIKSMVRELGGAAAGCTILDKEYIYSYKGRFDGNYGKKVTLDHLCALVFLVEMNFDAMQNAPRAETLRESARQYRRLTVIGKNVEALLRLLGHDAKAHYDAHYDVILPPLAVKAGLGELGRHNILIADRFGSRVRIGAVTTNMPLKLDKPVSLGADRFCAACKKCSDNCPPRALSTGEKEEVLGVPKWPTDVQQCFGYWRHCGTDCGICMACCPFSHRNNWFHNSVRWFVRHFPWLHGIALRLDDLAYGRDWKKKEREKSG